MKKLQENGIVERVGGKKTGNWKALRKEQYDYRMYKKGT
jgi:hypothetical protein